MMSIADKLLHKPRRELHHQVNYSLIVSWLVAFVKPIMIGGVGALILWLCLR